MAVSAVESEEVLLGTTYLRRGSPRQRAAAETLDALRVDSLIGVSEWSLAGTVPLEVDLPGADLDVLIYAPEPSGVRDQLYEHFSIRAGFSVWPHSAEPGAWCVTFKTETFQVEFFIQDRPLRGQRAFRHLVAEYVLLERGGEQLRNRIRQLKASGLKTEPAFAEALGLTGDPYVALLDLKL